MQPQALAAYCPQFAWPFRWLMDASFRDAPAESDAFRIAQVHDRFPHARAEDPSLGKEAFIARESRIVRREIHRSVWV